MDDSSRSVGNGGSCYLWTFCCFLPCVSAPVALRSSYSVLNYVFVWTKAGIPSWDWSMFPRFAGILSALISSQWVCHPFAESWWFVSLFQDLQSAPELTGRYLRLCWSVSNRLAFLISSLWSLKKVKQSVCWDVLSLKVVLAHAFRQTFHLWSAWVVQSLCHFLSSTSYDFLRQTSWPKPPP